MNPRGPVPRAGPTPKERGCGPFVGHPNRKKYDRPRGGPHSNAVWPGTPMKSKCGTNRNLLKSSSSPKLPGSKTTKEIGSSGCAGWKVKLSPGSTTPPEPGIHSRCPSCTALAAHVRSLGARSRPIGWCLPAASFISRVLVTTSTLQTRRTQSRYAASRASTRPDGRPIPSATRCSCSSFQFLRSSTVYVLVSVSMRAASVAQSQIAFSIEARSSGVKFASYRGPFSAAAVICAARPMFEYALEDSSLGPTQGTPQCGAEQR